MPPYDRPVCVCAHIPISPLENGPTRQFLFVRLPECSSARMLRILKTENAYCRWGVGGLRFFRLSLLPCPLLSCCCCYGGGGGLFFEPIYLLHVVLGLPGLILRYTKGMANAQELSTRMHFTSGQYKFSSFKHKKYSNY